MSKILITGSRGLIGNEVLDRLLHEDVISFDLKNDLIQDVRNYESLPINEDIEGIIHLAAVTRVEDAENNPIDCINTNIRGTYNILKFAKELKDKGKAPWVISASSREVYGNQKFLPVKEHWPKAPLQLYGVSKVAGEYLCESYVKRYELKVRIVRFSNVYTSIYDRLNRVTPKWILRALRNLPLEINGDGSETFDFTYIKDIGDAVKALVKEIRSSEQLFNDFNIASGQAKTLGELAFWIKKISKSNSKIVYKPRRVFEVHKFYGDPEKSSKFLKWKHRTPFHKGLELAIKELYTIPDDQIDKSILI